MASIECIRMAFINGQSIGLLKINDKMCKLMLFSLNDISIHCSQLNCYFVLIALVSCLFFDCLTSLNIIIEFCKCTSIVSHLIRMKTMDACVYLYITVQNLTQNTITWTIIQSIDAYTLHWHTNTVFKYAFSCISI